MRVYKKSFSLEKLTFTTLTKSQKNKIVKKGFMENNVDLEALL